MKVMFLVSIMFLIMGYVWADSCSASPTSCSDSCTAIAGPGEEVDCFEDTSYAACSVTNAQGLVSEEEIYCNTGGGGGGNGAGSGGGSTGCINTLGCWPWLL